MRSDAQPQEQRTAEARQAISDQLLASGSSHTPIRELTITIDEWRGAARAVGRALKRPIKTFVAGGSVFAVLGDWPTGSHEEERHEQNFQRAAAAANEYIERRLGS